MPQPGYCRYPTIHDDRVVFAAEDDLWLAPAGGGTAERLMAGVGEASWPSLSPSGEEIALIGSEEGAPDVYRMNLSGGPLERLTYCGALATAGWSPDGEQVYFASNASQPMMRMYHLHAADRAGGLADLLPYGPAVAICHRPSGGVVLGRHGFDPARWKRYRGGTAGVLWIDPDGGGEFRVLIDLPGQQSRPMPIGERIYFLSDHEGIGNLYSCQEDGGDLRRHTDHVDYYARHASSDGQRIVYQAGAELFLYEPDDDAARPISLAMRSTRTQANRKFVDAARYLEFYDPHPQGDSVAVTTRGQVHSMALWEGGVRRHGDGDGVRLRMARWLHDGARLVAVTDAPEQYETLEVFSTDVSVEPRRLPDLDLGRPLRLETSLTADRVAISNHRYELIVVDLQEQTATRIDRSDHDRIEGFAWSPDGRWLAYSVAETSETAAIKIYDLEAGESRRVTEPLLCDVQPSFDPLGRYLYFLSYRVFDPVYDNLHFDLGFPRGMKPYLVTLRSDLPSPFEPTPRAPGKKLEPPSPPDTNEAADAATGDDATESPDEGGAAKAGDTGGDTCPPPPVEIDFEGIADRVVAVPVAEGRYGRVHGTAGRILYTVYPVEGALGVNWRSETPRHKGELFAFSFEDQEAKRIMGEVGSFRLSHEGKTLLVRSNRRLRAVAAEGEIDANQTEPGRKSGWLDLKRLRVSVRPLAERKQMLREAWRLQREHFWVADMSQIDWSAVYDRYAPLVDRVVTRSEFSDLLWEMQGELGTSHAYEMGGDYRLAPQYRQGFLGAELQFDAQHRCYAIERIFRGDPWAEAAGSPLRAPGVNATPGDLILAVNGRRVSEHVAPDELLVHCAGQRVELTLQTPGEEPRQVVVKALANDRAARYRDWVEGHRQQVSRATGGRVGYVHIPDMGPAGYAEFHRYFLAQLDREALIIDVRCNGGGHVSPLIVEKLARRPMGYVKRRWGKPIPHPDGVFSGPLVAITNELAGSDGDKFSHVFKSLELGPLIGTRTWGGLIGIWPRHRLVDGSITTQPEYSYWFQDVGWGIENYGVDPTIEVAYPPHDYVAGRDPQLERAIAEAKERLAPEPRGEPVLTPRPVLTPPKLPRR